MSPRRQAEVWHRFIVVALAVAITIPVLVKGRPSVLTTAPAAFSTMSSVVGYVRICGDVRHPGIYPITANLMTVGAIGLAEPRQAPTVYLPAGSEARPLKSGDDIRVELRPNGSAMISCGSLPTPQRLALGIPLDINAMNEADFDRVPGIGPVLASRIVAYRQNHGGLMAVQELLTIEGIGQRKYFHLSKFFN